MTHIGGWRRLAWHLVRQMHHWDFAVVLPLLGKLPLRLGYALAHWRGRFNALTGRDWRSVALGFRHVQRQSQLAYRTLAPTASPADVQRMTQERFQTEAMDEFEARLLAEHRVHELTCDFQPPEAANACTDRPRGLVLLTPHFASFCLGMAFLARQGGTSHAMSSGVTHLEEVDPAVQAHFHGKYRGLERYFHGGKVMDLEDGLRPFYRALQARQTLMVLGDAPVLPNGVAWTLPFLGHDRQLAGGALRMAQQTDSDLAAFVCQQTSLGRYQVRMSRIGRAQEPETIRAAYQFLSQEIMRAPGAWWACDLLPAMPTVTSPPADAPAPHLPAQVGAPGPMMGTACDAVLMQTSPLQGTAELAHGLRQLQQVLSPSIRRWFDTSSPAAQVLWDAHEVDAAPWLLVLTQPDLIASADLVPRLLESLQGTSAWCAISADPRHQNGEWAITYITRSEFEQYQAVRRSRLPATAAPTPQDPPWAYLVLKSAAHDLIKYRPGLTWSALPFATEGHTVLAPRAFVHSYQDYQQGGRPDMLALVPLSARKVLDIGGGEGGFAQAVIHHIGADVWLAEPHTPAAERARARGLQVLTLPIEGLTPATTPGPFDLVCLLDVLEHLTEPTAALRQVSTLLTKGGHLLISTPNLGHWSIVKALASGRFDYLPVGTLCNTHVHFFTAKTLEETLRQVGFTPIQWQNKMSPVSDSERDFIRQAIRAGHPWDETQLQTESLHVLARWD